MPLSLEERMRTYIVERLGGLDALHHGATFIGDGVPLNWQSLVRYLHQQDIVSAPQFLFGKMRNDRPKVYNAQLSLKQDARKTDGRILGDSGFGAAFSAEEALSKTVGETLERFFLSTYKREHLRRASWNDIRNSRTNALDIRSLNTFLTWQKSSRPEFDVKDDSPLYWTAGEDLATGKEAWLPAQLVFWNYKHSDERMLARTTTSGCAGHFSKKEAVLSSLLENIQRDGFFMYWLNSLPPRIIDTSGVRGEEFHRLLETLARYRLEPIFVNTTSDVGVPSVTCVLIDRTLPESPIISIGGGTGFELENILVHSAIESLLINTYAADTETYKLSTPHEAFTDARIWRPQRLSAWKGSEMERRFDFFISGKKQSAEEFMGHAGSLRSTEEQLAYILEKLGKLGEGYEVYVYEARNPVLKTLGYHAVRTIVPQLFPLYLWEPAAPLESKRLGEVPQKLGYAPARKINPWPHPFP